MPSTGSKHTSDSRAKISEAQQDIWSSPSRRKAKSAELKGLWQDPEFRAKQARGRLEARARSLGTTVERLEAEPLPAKGRHEVLKGLFWHGLGIKEVVALHPRVPYNSVHRAMSAVTVEWFNRTGLFGLPADHPEVLELL